MSEETMAAVISPQPTKPQSTSPGALPPQSSSSPNPNLSSLSPLLTSPPLKSQATQRAPSYPKHRLSTFSTRSNASNPNMFGSRPQSVAFPQFHSSLPYALVRDFAYPPYHLLHYGPPPERESGISTPASEAQHRRLSDPVPAWSGSKVEWQTQPWSTIGEHLPTTAFGDHDGPPWSEDEDLASPVVTSSRHRKNKSNPIGLEQQHRGRTSSFQGMNGDGSETFYIGEMNETANGPGGDFITYPPNAQQDSSLRVPSSERRRDSHFATRLPNRSYENSAFDMESSPESPNDDDDFIDVNESRYSRDYQFTIASPDEEMHGRAVALFDFARENENELPLVEGQVILVSYRHGQGWLVAQDPKTGDTGLVPEEYVRLLRDIEGGLHGLMNGQPIVAEDDTPIDSAEARTPTQIEHNHPLSADGSKEYYAPVVSTFSTSREDFEPWPHHLLGSQVSTPTMPSNFPRRGSEDRRDRNSGESLLEQKGSEAKAGGHDEDQNMEDVHAESAKPAEGFTGEKAVS